LNAERIPKPLSAAATATAPRGEARMRHDLDFLEFLKTFRRGEVLDEADQRLSELVEAIALHQGKGTLTLKLSFKVNKADQPAPMLDWIALDRMVIDDSYQRPLNRANWVVIHKIAADFRWSRFGPILVSPIAADPTPCLRALKE